MFQKVLIVDDHATSSQGVSKLLTSIGVEVVETTFYCDDARLKVIKAHDILEDPYDLVITDLSFKQDHRDCDLKGGEDLVKHLRNLYPNLPVIVYSMEDHFQKVRELINECGANAYVCKSRTSEKELKAAIHSVSVNKMYLSKEVRKALQVNAENSLTPYEKEVAKSLSEGMSQPQISSYLRKYNISPNSLSSIEKCINRLKDQYNANNAVHLVSMLKDAKLI